MSVSGSVTPAAGAERQGTGTGGEPACDGHERVVFEGNGEEAAGENGCDAREEECTNSSAS